MMAIFRRRCAIVRFDIILFWGWFETMRRTDCCIALAPSMRARARSHTKSAALNASQYHSSRRSDR